MALVLIFGGHKCFLDPFNADLLAQAVNHLAGSWLVLICYSRLCCGVNTGERWRSLQFWSVSHPLPHPQPRKIRTYTIQPRGYPVQPRSSARLAPAFCRLNPGFAGASLKFA